MTYFKKMSIYDYEDSILFCSPYLAFLNYCRRMHTDIWFELQKFDATYDFSSISFETEEGYLEFMMTFG